MENNMLLRDESSGNTKRPSLGRVRAPIWSSCLQGIKTKLQKREHSVEFKKRGGEGQKSDMKTKKYNLRKLKLLH